jgi:hypothetical protein
MTPVVTRAETAEVELLVAHLDSIGRGAALLRHLTDTDLADLTAAVATLGAGRIDPTLLRDKAAALR